ncbi:hypothetical protein K432DRAFT_425103 [Lepidopterella palustris CBS 459.81]|uniref:Uncharacterized protein n=1 Tax=Lepidopterella palustris CBS 459.81 TaxID=1314670 RepID=A0A8E2ECI3_9PEZI|nr:hypothetical protein K432DRAFT_425103 [Lepidopterella palustris CBS 459.81]
MSRGDVEKAIKASRATGRTRMDSSQPKTLTQSAKVMKPRKGNIFPALKYHRNRLINLNAPASDVRMIIAARNRESSPLLRLPPELRNKIFAFAMGGYHIHITDVGIPPPPPPTGVWDLIYYLWRRLSRPSDASPSDDTPPSEGLPAQLYNYVYTESDRPLYSTTPDCTHPDDIKLTFKWSPNHMTLISRTCRQIYDETGLLYYQLNAFSFNSSSTMRRWVGCRLPVQKRALESLWTNLDWLQKDRWSNWMQPLQLCTGLKVVHVSKMLYRARIDWWGVLFPASIIDDHIGRWSEQLVYYLPKGTRLELVE